MIIKPNPYLSDLTCLYVEDDKEVRESFLFIIKKIFKNIYIAGNGEEGLLLFKQKHPDIVISDIKMPVMDGIEMCKKIKEVDPDAYVIFLTAFTDITFLKQAIDLGVEGYITKPVDKKKLYQKLNFLAEILKHKKEAKENLMLLQTLFDEQKDSVILAKDNFIKLKNLSFKNEFGEFETLDDLEEFLNIDLIFDEKPTVANICQDNISKTYEITYKKINNMYKIITFKDITDMNKNIYTDELTQAYNRKFLNKYINTFFNKKICFIIIDIDNFKQINDKYGHLIGDSVLKELSALIKNNLRKEDYFFRWGGEEFLIIPNRVDDVKTAEKIALHIKENIQKTAFSGIEKLTCSFGVACGHIKNLEDINTLFDHADKALYEAKKAGKNQVKVYE